MRAADGRVVGTLRDLTARLGVEHPVVYRLAIGARRRLTHLVPWTAVAAFERSEIRLRDGGPVDRLLIGRGEIPLLVFMYGISRDRDLMGDHTPNRPAAVLYLAPIAGITRARGRCSDPMGRWADGP